MVTLILFIYAIINFISCTFLFNGFSANNEKTLCMIARLNRTSARKVDDFVLEHSTGSGKCKCKCSGIIAVSFSLQLIESGAKRFDHFAVLL